MIGLACPSCAAIRTGKESLKKHLCLEHGGFTEADLSEAEQIDTPKSEQVLELLEDEQRKVLARTLRHLQDCEFAGTEVEGPNAYPVAMLATDECATCCRLERTLSLISGTMENVKEMGTAGLENLL